MSHELYYDSALECMFLHFTGNVTLDLIAEVAPHVAAMSDETKCLRLLNDMSEATIDISVVNLFDSPKVMDESKVSRSLKRALVVPASFSDSAFLEDVSQNRGHCLRVFSDIEKAKEWLFAE